MTNEEIKRALTDIIEQAIRNGIEPNAKILQRLRDLIADIEEGA